MWQRHGHLFRMAHGGENTHILHAYSCFTAITAVQLWRKNSQNSMVILVILFYSFYPLIFTSMFPCYLRVLPFPQGYKQCSAWSPPYIGRKDWVQVSKWWERDQARGGLRGSFFIFGGCMLIMCLNLWPAHLGRCFVFLCEDDDESSHWRKACAP